jgi:glycosyltransferase involved in cell wall biosynthesis
MRSLHLLSNTSSLINTTVGGLRSIGEEAFGLVYQRNWAQSNNSDLCEVIVEQPRTMRLARHWQKIRTATRAIHYIRQVDVVHWYNGYAAWNSLDMMVARRMGKRGIVEFLGGDIRNSEIVSALSPAYATAWNQGGYEYPEETAEHSRKVQTSFLSHGVRSVLSHPQLECNLIEGWEQRFSSIRVRVDLAELPLAPPTPEDSIPLVVHMTTAPVCKGTAHVEAALENLRKSGLKFRYQRIEGMQRSEVMRWLSECDLYLDNFVLGEGFPVGAIEAMAMGKPVISFSRPDVAPMWQRDPEVYVNASLNELEGAIADLLPDRKRRLELGQRGRAYVEEVHDAKVQAKNLVKIYEQVRKMG